MYFKASEQVIKIVILKLREFFATKQYSEAGELFQHIEQFRYNDDRKLTKISIFDQFPLEDKAYPRIIVTDVPGNSTEIGLGQNAGGVVNRERSEAYEIYGGAFHFNLSLQLATASRLDTKRLTDIVLGALAFYIRRDLQKEDIMPIPAEHIRLSAIMAEEITPLGLKVYRSTLIYPLRVEWSQAIPLEPINGFIIEAVKGIPIIELKPLLFSSAFGDNLDESFPIGWKENTFILNSGFSIEPIGMLCQVEKSLLCLYEPSGKDGWYGKFVEVNNLTVEKAVELEVKLRTLQFDESQDIALGIILYLDDDNYFFAGLKQENLGKRGAYWGKKIAGVWSEELIKDERSWDAAFWYYLRLWYNGDKLRLSIDRELKIVQEIALQNFKIGLGAFTSTGTMDCKAMFDNVEIWKLKFNEELTY